MSDLLYQLRALFVVDGSGLLVDSLAFHGLCVTARGRVTVAEPDGWAFHELEKVAYRLGRREGSNWRLPKDLVEALTKRGLGERLSLAQERALRAWRPMRLSPFSPRR